MPRTQRSASLRCAAEPGPIVPAAQERGSRLCGASYRTMLRIAGRTLHRVRDTNFRYQCSRQTAKTQALILAAHSARAVQYHVPRKNRGRRESRVPNAPAASCAKIKAHELVTTGPPETSRPSLRNGLRLIARSPPASGPPSPALLSADLIPASLDQDHTISPSAMVSLVLRRHPRPSHPAPRS